MAERLTPDICVVGAGSGGLSVAAAAAAFGVPVVLIEKGKMGGECLNTGCVPSKSLIAAGKRARAIADAAAFGVSTEAAEIDFAKVHRHVHGVIAAIAPNDSKARFNGLGVRVIEGAARFKDRETVIGAGAIGLELAQAFRRLGSAVTVLEAAQPLAREDNECAAIVLDALTREGVTIRSHVAVARLEAAAGKIKVVFGDGAPAIEGSHLLIATGRKANTEGLALEAAGITCDRNGIVVDNGLKTA